MKTLIDEITQPDAVVSSRLPSSRNRVFELDQIDWSGVFSELPAGFSARPKCDEAPLSNILEHLKKLDCKRVVMNFPYRDKDYLDDYLKHFGESFLDGGKDCVRLHFFTKVGRLEEDTIVQDVRKISPKDYLGFMVVRPTGSDCVGRTIIRAPYDPAKPNKPFIHTAASYKARFLGTDLKVDGVPFLQQDKVSHICASASLWSMCCDLHRRYQSPRLYPREVTEIATSNDPVISQGGGLNLKQIMRVLRHVGCGRHTTILSFGDKESDESKRSKLSDVVDVIYGYVQSNIPVLIGYFGYGKKDGHAALIVGHDFIKPESDSGKMDSGNSKFVWSSEFVKKFFCQDDQRGPYQPLAIWAKDGKWGKTNPSLTIKGVPTLQRVQDLFIVPGVTSAARMNYSDARLRVESALEDANLRLIKKTECTKGEEKDEEKQSAIDSLRNLIKLREISRIRLYLQLQHRFRTQVLDEERGRTNLGNEITAAYCQLPLPSLLWVCDFVACNPNKDGRYNLYGEMLLDGTSLRFFHESSLLSIRIDNKLRIRIGPEWTTVVSTNWSPDDPHIASVNHGSY